MTFLQMAGLSFSHSTEQTEREEEGPEDVVESDFGLDLTDVMEDFQAFLHFHDDFYHICVVEQLT